MDDYQSFTYVEDSDIVNTSNIDIQPVCINLLPGETIITFDTLNYGCRLSLTNFRIIIIFDIFKENVSTFDIISIPLGLIYHIEQYGFVCLNIVTKVCRKFSVTFPNIELCEEIIQKIKVARAWKPFGIDFCKSLKEEIPNHFFLGIDNAGQPDNHDLHIIECEFKRMKFDTESWRISHINKDFKLCSTYPQYHIVPNSITDEMIKSMAKFRSKNRFISVSYRSIETGTVMLRSGQPLTGVSCWRNPADEDYFRAINSLYHQNFSDKVESCLKIFDARSYTSAQLNRVKGGGMECEAYYHNSMVEFLNIPNMHTVRSSFENLSKAVLENESDNFYDLVARSNWLQLIKQLLKSATSISDTMHSKRKSVLIHCSDGWDRTPQLASLSQIIMDPFYRTIEGFKILVHREWILFGHKFNERCALWPFDYSREYSPIFLQWLDCVYQLVHQFPDYFHFNETFLIKLALHVYSGLFGTFNGEVSKSHDSCSIWSFLCQKEMRNFTNPLYSPKMTFKIMRPKLKMLNIKLWTGLYFDCLNPNYHEIQYSESYSGEIPTEINNISMMNSLMICTDELDDYAGEDDKFQPPLLSDFSEGSLVSIHPSKKRSNNSEIKSYFNAVYLKCSIKSIEDKPMNDPEIHFEIDLDGLFKQKDLLENFAESNRRCRHLYKSKVRYFQKELENLRHEIQSKYLSLTEPCEDDEEIETLGSDPADVESVDSQLTIIDDVVLWIPDHAVMNCHACMVEFGLFNRKHHCRSCGKIFCNNCSKRQANVPKQKLHWNVRVCEQCFGELGGCSTVAQSRSVVSRLLFFVNLS